MTSLKANFMYVVVALMMFCHTYNGYCQSSSARMEQGALQVEQSGAEPPCLFTRAQATQMRNPAFKAAQDAIEQKLYREAVKLREGQQKQGTGRQLQSEALLTIPLVIHIIHLSSEPFPGDGPSNPTDAQIMAGITHLNDAYRNVGAFAGNGHQAHPALQSVDVGIEFCLAQRDINGEPTTGILRYANDTYANLNFDLEDPQMQEWVAQQNNFAYPTTDYAHVWLVNDICSGTGEPGDPETCNTAGYAYLPGGHGQINNGVVNLSSYWGTSSNSSKVHIHEFGHFLNLYHTFQGGCVNNDCLSDGDRVCDTPPDNSFGFSNCGQPHNSCSTDTDDPSTNNPFQTDVDDLYENYMDYSSNACQNTFTQGQKDRMRSTLLGIRSSLLSSQACIPVSGVEAGLNRILFPDLNVCSRSFTPVVEVQNNGDEPLSALTFEITVDEGTAQEANWSGNIPVGAVVPIALEEITIIGSGLHELHVELLTANGEPDPFTNNNIAIQTFQYTPTQSTPFCTDLETGTLPAAWTISNPDNYVGFETYTPTACANNADYMLGLQTWGAFPGRETVDQILTEPFLLGEEAELSFEVAHALTYSNFNTVLDIAVSTNCGLTFTSVYNKTADDLATVYVPANSADDPNAFYIPAECDEWRTESISLAAYAGEEILIRFEASTEDVAGSSFGYYWGNNLYLDNICISGTGTVSSDCSMEELELLSGEIATGTYNDVSVILAGTELANDAEVQFEAAESIYLLPGFSTEDALAFQAVIAPCNAAARTEATVMQANLEIQAEKTPELKAGVLPKIALKVYPNPFATAATVSYYFEQPLQEATLLLSDMSGQILRSIPVLTTEAGWHQLALERQGLSAGIYLLQLRTPEQLISKKLIVL